MKTRNRFLRPARVAVCIAACAAGSRAAVPPRAHAESVAIGRYAEIHVGVSHRHAYATEGGDAQRTGRSRAHAPSAPPTRRWSVVLPTQRLLAPLVMADGTLIVGSATGVYALDPRDGLQRWFAPIGAVRGSPSITPDGEVTVVADGKLLTLQEGGRARQRGALVDLVGELLVLDSGALVVAGLDGALHVVAPDGSDVSSVTWDATLPRWLASQRGGSVVVAGLAAEVMLMSHGRGGARRVQIGESVTVRPLVGDGDSVWALSERGTVWVIAPGAVPQPIASLGQNGISVPASLGRDGGLRVALRYGEIVCVDASGTIRWRRGIDSPSSPMLLAADDTTLLVSGAGTLYAIDHSGELRWRVATEMRAGGRPVMGADGTLYLVGRGGRIEAWR